MSKKKSRWTPRKAAIPEIASPKPEPVAQAVSPAEDVYPISPVQLAANRANAQLSTGPRTEAGKARSSQNAVKSGLTGRTVLLPTDDVEEYARFLAEYQQHHKPVGLVECELVQIVVDCHWRLRRIQELEYALYAHGEEQFAPAFADLDPLQRRSKIVLQTHLTYQKELRNFHIQEARLDRKRRNALAELEQLQSERNAAAEQSREQSEWNNSDLALYPNDNQPVPQNGFVFSDGNSAPQPNLPSSAS